MIVYFADRKMNILGHASTDLPEGNVIANDKKTEEIESGVATFEFELHYIASGRKKAEAMTTPGNYILRKNGSDCEFYTIISTESDIDNAEIFVYAEDAGLDLLNEVVESYEADKAYPAKHYVEKFSYDSGFVIGLNEISDRERKLKWEGTATATERLLSVATQFDAELSFSFEIEGMCITKKMINLFKKRGKDAGIELRKGREVGNIRVRKSVENLATALRCTGGTPEGQETPITLSGYSYDDGEDFYTEGPYLMSRKALAIWSRYVLETGDDVGHIVRQYSYDTTSQSELCNRAISELKKLCQIEINYEVEILTLPDNVKIGDTINIVDDGGELYLSARILQLEECASQRTQTAILGNYLIKDSGISDRLQELAKEFEQMAASRTLYTWVAYADDAAGTGISLNPEGKAYMGIAANRFSKEEDISDPTVYVWKNVEGIPGQDGKPGKDGEKGDKGDPGARGLQGLQGEKGDQGIPGPKGDAGADGAQGPKGDKGDKGDQGVAGVKGDKGDPGTNGKTSYFHIKYSAKANPTTAADMSETPNTYIGTYVDFTQADSTDPTKYTWSQFKGSQGAKGDQGIAGTNGSNGKTSYLHIAYATSADGKTGFDVSNSVNKTYIGQYTDFTQADSTDPTKYSWTKIKGEQGADGNGIAFTDITYQAGSSQTTAPTGSWVTSVPKLSTDLPYLWTKTVITYTDGTSSTSYSVSSTLDGFEVGGRNLLLNTADFNTRLTSGATITSMTENVEVPEWGAKNAKTYVGVGGTSTVFMCIADAVYQPSILDMPYVTSIYVRNNHAVNNLYVRPNFKGSGETVPSVLIRAGEAKRIVIPSLGNGTGNVQVNFLTTNPGYQFNCTLWHPKIEEGTKVTAWTPAPEDTEKNLADNYYTKIQTDAAIKMQSDRITSTVTKIETVEKAVNEIEIGGRNLIPNTRDMSGYVNSNNVTLSEDNDGITVATFSATTELAWNSVKTMNPISFAALRNKKVTLSVLVRSDEYSDLNTSTDSGLVLTFGLCTGTSTNRTLYRTKAFYSTALSSDWKKITWTATLTDSFFSAGTGTIDDDTRLRVYVYNYSLYSMQIKKIKLEYGDKATDWTPAPEDVDKFISDVQTSANEANATADAVESRVTAAETIIDQLSNAISMLVTDGNGNSMMTQTSTGWTFDMSSINSSLNNAVQQLNAMVGDVANAENAISKLNSLANDLAEKTAYIIMTTDSSGQPCIELGKSDNAFKVRITNTSIDFMDGSSKIAYISNKALYIEKAIIKNELQIGDGEGFSWKKRSNGNAGIRWING